MRRLLIVVLAGWVLVSVTKTDAQISRKSQIEVFVGAAIPLSPDSFKDYFKVGGSLHGQYVIFPSPQLGVCFGVAFEGFTFDGEAFKQDFGAQTGVDLTGLNVEGTASLMEVGIGLRPYFSAPEATTQVFLLGMATYNAISTEATISYAGYKQTSKDDVSKFGVALGGGFEVPAGEKFNIIIQGLTRFIFTSKEGDQGGTTSFIGVTMGLVF